MKTVGRQTGSIVKISGPVVSATGLKEARLNDVVYVGKDRLIGEIIRIAGALVTIQVYEETSGVALGEPVVESGAPLSVTLGPGLLGQVFDGLQRPLQILAGQQGCFLSHGSFVDHLPSDKKWNFTPQVQPGDLVTEGHVLGVVQETENFLHPILIPPGKKGQILTIRSGEFSVNEPLGMLVTEFGEEIFTLSQQWPVRKPRPMGARRFSKTPLVSGTRIIDLFFPVAKGGTAVIPGGFGTGKTVTQQSLARWSDVDIVVYVGCGERGNEMAEVLTEFPQLSDPFTGRPLMERTVLIANTSNMPVAAREASIYTGMAIAEYFRSLGYDVLLLADSTSRWAEALREISGRLEEIPGEEGYPAYLSSRLAAFYERAGTCLVPGGIKAISKHETASITLVGAVSPPGSDFSEPVTQNSLRIAGAFWALDYDLSRRRHFPAINWLQSYSLYDFSTWYEETLSGDFLSITVQLKQLLRRETELLEIVQMIGKDTLSPAEQLVLWSARMLREDVLQQDAFDPIDRFCPLEKGYWMMKIVRDFYLQAVLFLEQGNPISRIESHSINQEIVKMKDLPSASAVVLLKKLSETMTNLFQNFEELI